MKFKKWKLITVLLAVLTLATAASLTVYAYFSTRVYVYTNDGNKEVAHLGMNLQLLFEKLDPVEGEGDTGVATGTELLIPYYEKDTNGYNVYHTGATGDCPTFDPSKPWGSPQNPYVISNERHLQNLSALQSVGYFDLMYIKNNFTETTTNDTTTYTYNNGVSMPYFLVCTTEGKPVVIDGTQIGAIRPIGSAEHPFIGVVGGAFASGSTFIDTDRDRTQDTGEKTTTVSTFHNVKVQTNTKQVDVGLFGYVGYLGVEPTEPTGTDSNGNPIYATTFNGATSIMQNLLLSDVQVVVKNPTVDEIISALFGSVWSQDFSDSNGHRFSYTGQQSEEAPIPEEDHHIGIFVGHVSYATVENISVYYSNNSIYAIDVTHTGTNYYSESGILGFMFNMNADVKNVGTADTNGNITTITGNCQIMMGTGTSSDDLEIPVIGSGSGTGGGLESGNGRGYVTAAEIFSKFNNVSVANVNNEVLWRYQPQGEDEVEGAILILRKSDGSYTLLDGKTKVTNISANSVTAGGNTWTKFFILMNEGTDENQFAYKTYGDGTNFGDVTSCELMSNVIHGKEVWKYEAGGDAIWHYGVRINKNGSSYSLADGGEAVSVNTNVLPVVPTATVGGVTCSFENFFVVDTSTNRAYIYDPFLPDETIEVTSFNRKPLDLIEGVTTGGEALCEEWMRETILGSIFGGDPEPSGMYYFYDGVFTFALSSLDDSIQDTWENDEVPTLYLGADDPTQWESNPATGNKAVVALLKQVTNNAALDAAIQAKKQIYITARPNGLSTEALLMSLNTDGKSPASINGRMLTIDDTLKESLRASYASGAYTKKPTVPQTGTTDIEMSVTLDMGGSEFWAPYTILNIGRTNGGNALNTLRNQFNIAAASGNTNYYFRNDTGTPVTPSNSTIPEYYSYDGYFFYTVDISDGDLGTTNFVFTLYYQEANNGEQITIATRSNSRWLNSNVDHSQLSNFIGTGTQKITFSTAYNAEGNAGGEDLYSYTYDGKTVTAPLIYMNDSQFVRRSGRNNNTYSPTTTAYVNGSLASKATGSTLGYYIWDAAAQGENKFFHADGTTQMTPEEVAAEDAKPDGTEGKLYRVNKYPSYQFSSNSATAPSYLQLLREYTTNTAGYTSGSKYSIWAGTDNQYGNLSMKREQEKKGVLVFEDDGCYIRYASGTASQYVNYSYSSSTKEGSFSGAANKGSNSKFYVYIIEGIIDMDYGVNTFIPKDYGEDGSTSLGFSADQYVLWPQYTLTSTGYSTNTGYANGALTGRSNTPSESVNATLATSTDPTYRLIRLQGDGGLNWGSANGYLLGETYGLHKKFQMKDQAGFGTMYNILGGNWEPSGSYGNYSMLVAPIGTNGVEATIPKGCVAFRVNTGKTETVRVIVAVPTTELYVGEDFNIDLVYDYYIGVWNVAAANEGTTFEFDKSDALEKFELPRSYTFDFENTPEDEEDGHGTTKNYVKIAYGNQTYRSYLNGDCFLVAYEFTVTGEGVYIIGSAHGNSNASSDKDVPMEIVHFSVSGTASAGRDGVAGSKLGSVDFVYDDTNGNIVTVGKTGTGGPVNQAENEDYANYYASQSLLHTNNLAKDTGGNFIKINNARVAIRRYIKSVSGENSTTYGQTTIAYSVGPPNSGQQAYIVVDKYMTNADTIERTEETSSSP